MQLVLRSCTVRSWREDDGPSLARHANNRRVWLNLRDRFPHPYTSDDAAHFLAWVPAQRPETNFAIAVGDEAVGGIGYQIQPDVHRISAEIGFWLGEAYWGRGIMTEALRAVTAHAFHTHNLHRLFAGVFDWNPASMRVLEKAGYTREAVLRKSAIKDGRIIDQALYAIVREP
jgi:RimJ/RimL family protein N-acetyltransferase